MLQKAVFYACMHMCMSGWMAVLTKNNNSSKARLYRGTVFIAFQSSRCECTDAHSESGMYLAFFQLHKTIFHSQPKYLFHTDPLLPSTSLEIF